MNFCSSSRRKLAIVFVCVAAALLLAPADVWARIGGGQGYGGGGSGGNGDGDGGLAYLIFELLRLLIYLNIYYPAIGIPLDIILIGGVVLYYFNRNRWSLSRPGATSVPTILTHDYRGVCREGVERSLRYLRKFDPDFSEITFTDFCYALYGRAHHERATGKLDNLSPYLSDEARKALMNRNTANLREIQGVIVGSMQVRDVQEVQVESEAFINISVDFEANYTEIAGENHSRSERGYYVQERWILERKRDVLSPPPAQATALHCPRCGAALMKDTNGACAFCGARIDSGEFQWFVTSIQLLSRGERGPALTADVAEVGTDYPTVVQRGFAEVRERFEANHPTFSWSEFLERARLIFSELQTAWSTLDWERARPHETDNIFQMHRYWIEAYKRQGLRNVLDNCTITSMQPVKITEDAFYNSITLRIGAQGYDYTIDHDGRIVSGSKNRLRRWTEYWTFIRNRNAVNYHSRADLNCPNCGAALKVNVTGICEFCSGKISSGEFDWVLSKIEQDESYDG